MTDKVLKKKYYRISFDLASPLALGSGENDSTDRDLLRDSAGTPYIPASSVAGVVRECLEKKDKALAEKYLGNVKKKTKDSDSDQSGSEVIFYDATIKEGTPLVTVRDSVALDEFKTAKSGAKFDMEVLEPGVRFVTYIEQDYRNGYEDDYGAEIAKVFLSKLPVFGAKGMRGYGAISNVEVSEKTFDMQNDLSDWLEFDPYAESTSWDETKIVPEKTDTRAIKLKVRLKGGISVRRYTTKVSTDDNTEPDMEQMTTADNTPVIPGTTWAGAIAHRMKEFGINTDNIFGFVNGNVDKMRSKIWFGETYLRDGDFKTLSRNAIDRFSGGTVDGALFTERIYYGGEGDLTIGWKSDDPIPDEEKKALAATLTDLHFGFLVVGGETSIGRGIFIIDSINDDSLPDALADNSAEIYGVILRNIEEAFK